MPDDTRHCTGCGVLIQTERPNRAGYVPQQALERDAAVCQRCFRIRHYNEGMETELTPDDYRKILEKIAAVDALVIQVVDIFDLEGSWIRGIPRYIGDNPILLVANKVDLLPQSANDQKLENWLWHSAREWGLRPIDVVVCSVQKNKNVEQLVEKIAHYQQGRDVYVIGATNVGKSSLINRLLQDYGGGGGDEITTSFYPGTTLGTIRIPLENDREIVDTPGIVNRDRLSEMVSSEDLRAIVPRARLRPKVYQLNAGQTLFFAGLARIDFKRGPHQPLVCYMAKDLYIHRTKLARADELYDRQLGKLLSPPSEKGELPSFSKRSYSIKGEKTDVVISGLGWVTCRGDTANIDVHTPRGISVSLRPAII